jgi:hypothetical protein
MNLKRRTSYLRYRVFDNKVKVKKKVKLSPYKPWRHIGGEELLLILNLGAIWG